MSHSLRYEVNCSILFTELSLLERPATAADAGFTAVELAQRLGTRLPDKLSGPGPRRC